MLLSYTFAPENAKVFFKNGVLTVCDKESFSVLCNKTILRARAGGNKLLQTFGAAV